MQHVYNIPRHVITVRPARVYPTKFKYKLYTFQWTELSLQLISLRWFGPGGGGGALPQDMGGGVQLWTWDPYP